MCWNRPVVDKWAVRARGQRRTHCQREYHNTTTTGAPRATTPSTPYTATADRPKGHQLNGQVCLWLCDFLSPVLQVCKGQQQHEEVCLGLFTLVLTEPPQAQRVRHYHLISNVWHRCDIAVTSHCACALTVLQRPDAGQQGRHERGPGEDQPDPDGEVSQAAGRPQDTGIHTHRYTEGIYTCIDG